MAEQSYIAEEERAASQQVAAQPAASCLQCNGDDAESFLIVESDLPDRLPVTREMLDIMERYFGDIIDEVLGDGRL